MTTKSKAMANYPNLAQRFTLLPSGVGRELKNLREAMDDGFYELENGVGPYVLDPLIYGSSEADIKAAGRAGDALSFLGGWPTGYEKASYSWTYTTGKQITVTAIKPGELGNLINIVWASAADDAVAVDGMTITISVDNDGATAPADLQALVAADARAKGMIAITSTDTTAIPNAFALAGPTAYLASGTGLGLGFDIQNNQVWGNTAAIAFIATKPGVAAAKYTVTWDDTGTLGVTADRKNVTIAYDDGVTTVADVVAAVNANRTAAEHLIAVAAGDGGGAVTGLDTLVFQLGLDFGTMVQVGDVYATITALTTSAVTYTYGANGLSAATTGNTRFRLGMVDRGVMSFPVIA